MWRDDLEKELSKEIQLNLEREKLKKVLDQINTKVLDCIELRKKVVKYILDLRKKILNSMKMMRIKLLNTLIMRYIQKKSSLDWSTRV